MPAENDEVSRRPNINTVLQRLSEKRKKPNSVSVLSLPPFVGCCSALRLRPYLLVINAAVIVFIIWNGLRMSEWIRYIADIYPPGAIDESEIVALACGSAPTSLSALYFFAAFFQYGQLTATMLIIIRRSTDCLKLALLLQAMCIVIDILLLFLCMFYYLRTCITVFWPMLLAIIELPATIAFAFFLHAWFEHLEIVSFKIRNPSLNIDDIIALGKLATKESQNNANGSLKVITAAGGQQSAQLVTPPSSLSAEKPAKHSDQAPNKAPAAKLPPSAAKTEPPPSDAKKDVRKKAA